jgi:hypothetical protein
MLKEYDGIEINTTSIDGDLSIDIYIYDRALALKSLTEELIEWLYCEYDMDLSEKEFKKYCDEEEEDWDDIITDIIKNKFKDEEGNI